MDYFHYFIQLFVFSWISLRNLSISSLRSLSIFIIVIFEIIILWFSCMDFLRAYCSMAISFWWRQIALCVYVRVFSKHLELWCLRCFLMSISCLVFVGRGSVPFFGCFPLWISLDPRQGWWLWGPSIVEGAPASWWRLLPLIQYMMM